MKAYRQTHSQAAHAATTSSARLQAFVWFVAATLAMAALLLAGSARAEAPATERIDITLDIEKLPAADLTRVRDRLQAIDLALTSQTKLFRSFAAREVLAESLQVLAANGADIGASAVINFDSIEIDIPAGTRDTIAALPLARRVRTPSRPIPASFPDPSYDSEWGGPPPYGLGYYAARTAGVTGSGITIAILDTNWDSLNPIIAEGGHIPDVPADN
ncbi:MAG: hypothetical protein VCC00_05685, partial [Deltaproteobacteria bacterium]